MKLEVSYFHKFLYSFIIVIIIIIISSSNSSSSSNLMKCLNFNGKN